MDQMTQEILAEQTQTKETIMTHQEQIEKRRMDCENRKRALKSFTASLLDFLGQKKTAVINKLLEFNHDETQRR